MRIESFEEVIAWKKARVLIVELYKVFGQHRDYGFRDQILRAGVSVMNNIAEGFDRNSDKELKQFLTIARGSAAEVRSMLVIAKDLGYIPEDSTLSLRAKEISRLLTGFIKSLH